MIPIQHYGLFRDGNLVFLHENSQGKCLTSGAETLDSPFVVARNDKLVAPHTLHTPMRGTLPEYIHPLVFAMAPLPMEGKAYYIPTDHKYLIAFMQMMIGGTQARTFVPWTLAGGFKRLIPELMLTNCAPLVIMDYEPRHYGAIEMFLKLPRLRNIILCGPLQLRGSEILPPFDMNKNYDWEEIGSALLERYVNGKSITTRSD